MLFTLLLNKLERFVNFKHFQSSFKASDKNIEYYIMKVLHNNKRSSLFFNPLRSILNISFSLYLMNGPNNLVRLSLTSLYNIV